MSEKIVKVNGESHSLAEWGRLLGISRQRVHTLYKNGELARYVSGEPKKTGRPMTSREEVRAYLSEPRSCEDIAEHMGICKATARNCVKEISAEAEIQEEYVKGTGGRPKKYYVERNKRTRR